MIGLPARLVDFMSSDYARVVQAVGATCGWDNAEDAVQEAMARSIGRLNEIDNLTAWITVVAQNQARSWRRRRKHGDELTDRERRSDGLPADELMANLDLLAAVKALPFRQRQAIVLYYLLDMDVAAVANAMRIKPGTVKASLHAARKSLLQALQVDEQLVPDHRGDPNE